MRRFELSKNIGLLVGLMLIIINKSACYGQLNTSVYEDFTQFFTNPYLLNPSLSDTSYRFKGQFNNLNELGLKSVSRFYLDADKRLNSENKAQQHNLGVQLTNYKLGDYINKSRFQLRYSWGVKISENATLSAGVSLGFINYSFLTTQSGTGGSDYAPDGAIGIHYLSKKTTVGIAVQQIFAPEIKSVNQSFQLKRLYNLDVSRKFHVSPEIDLNTQGLVQYSEYQNYLYSLGVLLEVLDVGLIGVNVFSFNMTSVSLGLRKIEFFNSNLSLLATYGFFQERIDIPNNTMELSIVLQK